MNKQKELSQFFTPSHIVDFMLDKIKYEYEYPENVLKKHIIDTSCGDGSFLVKITEIYILSAKKKNMSDNDIVNDLQIYIHGIEKDEDTAKRCISNIINKANEYIDASNFNPSIKCTDFLAFYSEDIKNKFDYVIGNPPYKRLGKIKESSVYMNKFKHIEDKNADIFGLFIESGLELLNETGKMVYILPSTFNTLNSLAALREHIILNDYLYGYDEVLDDSIFNAQVYTGIYTFNKSNYNGNVLFSKILSDTKTTNIYIKNKDVLINKCFFFGSKRILNVIKEIYNCDKQYVKIKNGIVTTKDNIYRNVDFDDFTINYYKCKKNEIPQKIFYPYDKKGNLINLSILYQNENIKKFLETNKNILLNRPNIREYEFQKYGKSQGLRDTYKKKLGFSNITNGYLFATYLPEGSHTCRLYMIPNKTNMSFEEIVTILKKQLFQFIMNEDNFYDRKQKIYIDNDYVDLKKIITVMATRQANGYYRISGKQLEKLLNYIIYKYISRKKY